MVYATLFHLVLSSDRRTSKLVVVISPQNKYTVAEQTDICDIEADVLITSRGVAVLSMHPL